MLSKSRRDLLWIFYHENQQEIPDATVSMVSLKLPADVISGSSGYFFARLGDRLEMIMEASSLDGMEELRDQLSLIWTRRLLHDTAMLMLL